MKRKLLILLMGIMVIAGAMMPNAAFALAAADSGGGGGGNSCNSDVNFFGLDPWWAALERDSKCEISQSNFQGDNLKGTIARIVGVVVKDLMFVAGFVAVGFVAYGGFLMVTSAGNPGAVEKAKKTISGALIGLVIAILAYAIVMTVMKVVTGEWGANG